jgi:peptidoglycan hydrolase-like protein with peptidoglycan-binding domain
MTRLRLLAATIAGLLLLGGVALATNEEADAQVLPPAVTVLPTTTTTAPPPPPPPPAPPKPTLRRGDNSADVQLVQAQLKAIGYDPGAINGTFGPETQFAVFALQKLYGLKPTGEVTPLEHELLAKGERPQPLAPDLGPDRVEVDLPRQIMTVYRGGAVHVITHISSGNGKRYCHPGRRKCGYAITPRGTFTISSMAKGWITGPLGRLYNPATFTRYGHALHGSLSVPLYPASHGCVRVPMHTAKFLPAMILKGMPVYVGG